MSDAKVVQQVVSRRIRKVVAVLYDYESATG